MRKLNSILIKHASC